MDNKYCIIKCVCPDEKHQVDNFSGGDHESKMYLLNIWEKAALLSP